MSNDIRKAFDDLIKGVRRMIDPENCGIKKESVDFFIIKEEK